MPPPDGILHDKWVEICEITIRPCKFLRIRSASDGIVLLRNKMGSLRKRIHGIIPL